MNEIRIEGLPLAEHVKRWDEYEGNLYELSALLTGDEEKRVTFGVRDFGDNGKGRLALNGSKLRGIPGNRIYAYDGKRMDRHSEYLQGLWN